MNRYHFYRTSVSYRRHKVLCSLSHIDFVLPEYPVNIPEIEFETSEFHFNRYKIPKEKF